MGVGQVQYNQPVWNQKQAYYTALQLDGSTAITDELKEGYALFKDLTNTTLVKPGASTSSQTTSALGVTVTRCEDGASGDNRHYFGGIVTNVKPGFTGPGWVWIISCGDAVACLVGNTTAVDPPTFLGGSSGQWYLATVSGSVASGAAMHSSVFRVVARPLTVTTIASGGVAANVDCDVGPVGGIG